MQPNVDIINDFYQELMEVMTDCMILDRKDAQGLV
jgi:GTP1/Obg family GTP-binding protein